MHTWIRRAMCALGLTGGVLLLGFLMAESASAAGNNTTSGQDGLGSGNQTGVHATAPVNLTGNHVTVIGHDNTATGSGSDATTGSTTAGTSGTSTGGNTTSGQDGIASGNQTGLGLQAPVNATGNQVTVIGHDNTATTSGDNATTGDSSGSTGGNTTSGQDGIASGNQTDAPLQAPVGITGNQVTVVGDGNTTDSSGGTSVVSPPATGSPGTPGGGPARGPARGLVRGPASGTGQTSPPMRSGASGADGGPAMSAATVAPVSAVLPNTGAPSDAATLAALALLLLAGGMLLLRRREEAC